MLAEKEVPLNGDCAASDRCSDANAVCIAGTCRCAVTHFPKNSICGKNWAVHSSMGILSLT